MPSVPVTFAKIKRGRGLAKDFATLQDSHTRPYVRKSVLTNASNDRFRWGTVYDLSYTFGCMEKFSSRQLGGKI